MISDRPAVGSGPDGTTRAALRGRSHGPGAAPEPWELHSELVLVCPELRAYALSTPLPEAPPPAPVAPAGRPVQGPPTSDRRELRTAVLVYTAFQTLRMAVTALVAIGAAVVVALIADFVAHAA